MYEFYGQSESTIGIFVKPIHYGNCWLAYNFGKIKFSQNCAIFDNFNLSDILLNFVENRNPNVSAGSKFYMAPWSDW